MSFIVLFISCWIYITFSQDFLNITIDDIASLRITLDDLFDKSGTLHPLVGTTVRLVFHDCAGSPENSTVGNASICDGCVYLSSPDHRGLKQEVIDILEDIFMNEGPDDDTKWQDKMSLADFWVTAGTMAIQYSQVRDQNNGGTDKLPSIPFYFGRDDCSTSPNVDNNTTFIKALPSGLDGWDESEAWFDTNFGLDTEEMVALIGAHTLGRAHLAVSGFQNPWVAAWDTFNNKFYIDLINNVWTQRESNKQWNSGGFMMLNSDIAMWKNIDAEINDTNGEVACSFSECEQNNETESFVTAFANDNALWLEKFVQAWIKMITIGYDIDQLFVVDETDEFPMISTTSVTMTTAKPSDSDSFDFMAWINENWLYVVIGAAALIVIVCLIIVCCRQSKKRREKNEKNVEMFGMTAV